MITTMVISTQISVNIYILKSPLITATTDNLHAHISLVLTIATHNEGRVFCFVNNRFMWN